MLAIVSLIVVLLALVSASNKGYLDNLFSAVARLVLAGVAMSLGWFVLEMLSVILWGSVAIPETLATLIGGSILWSVLVYSVLKRRGAGADLDTRVLTSTLLAHDAAVFAIGQENSPINNTTR